MCTSVLDLLPPQGMVKLSCREVTAPMASLCKSITFPRGVVARAVPPSPVINA